MKRMFCLRCVVFFTFFLLYAGSVSSQELDSIAEKAEPAAVNTNSTNYTDSAAAFKFKTIDGYILKLKKKNKAVPILAKYITATCTTDEEKIRALFIWMTNNIAFDCLTYHNKKTFFSTQFVYILTPNNLISSVSPLQKMSVQRVSSFSSLSFFLIKGPYTDEFTKIYVS